jgi:ACS family sodium-dependent inorganic phosphate cotransporter/ACS family sodium-dependent inorganic phosphate cotransporter-like MFS transporter 9
MLRHVLLAACQAACLVSGCQVSVIRVARLLVMLLSYIPAGQAGFVANMSDIAPRHAGTLFGLCNTFGSFAGILGVSGEHVEPVFVLVREV